MTPTRLHRHAGAKGRRGSAMILVLLLTFALAALAGSAILLSSTATQTVKAREGEKDLRYAADAAIAAGESQVMNDPTAVPPGGYNTLASNAAMLAADSTQVPGLTYNLYVGPTGSASRQNGRFVTLVAQSMDSAHHRTFVRRVELMQESFAKFAYFSNSENGICFGSGDVLWGPVFSNDNISVCGGQVATFEDSVESHHTVDTANGVWHDQPVSNADSVALPSVAGLARLLPLAAAGNTSFTSPNTSTDSTSRLRSRIEFDAYNDSTPVLGADSVQQGEGFVKFYKIDETLTYWTGVASASRDSSAASYLRAGLYRRGDVRNCGDWHFVWDSSASVTAGSNQYHWEFFPAAVHDMTWFYTAMSNQRFVDGNGNIYRFVKDDNLAVHAIGLDSNFTADSNSHGWLTAVKRDSNMVHNEQTTPNAANQWAVQISTYTPRKDANSPAPACYPAGNPHLVAMERVNWVGANTFGMGNRGGVDSTYTFGTGGSTNPIPNGDGVGRWVLWPSSAIAFANANFKPNHADWPALFPIDTVKNAAFKGVIAVTGSTGVSGNVDGHVTMYVNGNVGLIDNVRLVTGTADTNCQHGLGILSVNDITALDNGINVPQHWTRHTTPDGTIADWSDLRPTTFGGSLYVQSTVMALGSWGAEGLASGDTSYNTSTVFCAQAQPADYYKRGCLYVFGSIIQNTRQTVNSGAGGPGGYGYDKQYSYDLCAVKNPLPYFPTTGRLIENKYYEHDPNQFNVTALYQSLQLP